MRTRGKAVQRRFHFVHLRLPGLDVRHDLLLNVEREFWYSQAANLFRVDIGLADNLAAECINLLTAQN